MSTLIITRGYPGSGKTTWARTLTTNLPGVVRVNRDDVRMNMYGRKVALPYDQEQAVTVAQHAAVAALLDAGTSVVVDDTNLRARHARAWADLASRGGHDFLVEDFTTSVAECIRRDADREVPVGADVIQKMAARFPISRWPEIAPTPDRAAAVEPYVPDEALPPAWIVDVDGTLAHMGDRSPFDWDRVGEDTPDPVVVSLVRALREAGNAIVIMSGRSDECRPHTATWLRHHVGGNPVIAEMHMRAAGDNRPDAIVKAELFNTHIRDRWCVRGVLDDRNSVVAMWRALGLKTLQVAPGDF